MAFDIAGADINGMGYPSMGQIADKYHRTDAVWKDKIDATGQQEGLWGGYLPITSFYFKIAGSAPAPSGTCVNGTSTVPQPCKEKGKTFCPSNPAGGQCEASPAACPPCPPPPAPAPGGPCHRPCTHNPKACCDCSGGEKPCPHNPAQCCKLARLGLGTDSSSSSSSAVGGYIEMTACPVADMQGNMEQAAFFRFQKSSANGTVLDTKYFDTFAYTAGAFQSPEQVPASGEPPGSATAKAFYAQVLEQKRWWAAELQAEGMLKMDLPSDADTDGVMLHNMALHSLVRDMITRRNNFFPVSLQRALTTVTLSRPHATVAPVASSRKCVVHNAGIRGAAWQLRDADGDRLS